jgi:hypothetical protein
VDLNHQGLQALDLCSLPFELSHTGKNLFCLHMPINQRKADLINENLVLGDSRRAFTKHLGFNLNPSKDDAIAHSDCLWRLDDDSAALVHEHKCRFNAKTEYATLTIDKYKIDANIRLAERHRVGFLLSIWWGEDDAGDPVVWARFIDRAQAAEFRTERKGRDDRPGQFNDDKDVQYHIPVDSFNLSIRMTYDRVRSPNKRNGR